MNHVICRKEFYQNASTFSFSLDLLYSAAKQQHSYRCCIGLLFEHRHISLFSSFYLHIARLLMLICVWSISMNKTHTFPVMALKFHLTDCLGLIVLSQKLSRQAVCLESVMILVLKMQYRGWK